MGLVLLFVLLLLTRDTTFSVWSKRAGTNLHNQLFRRVLSAPILFFLRTPVGDVLNAFARDQVRGCQLGTVTPVLTILFLGNVHDRLALLGGS